MDQLRGGPAYYLTGLAVFAAGLIGGMVWGSGAWDLLEGAQISSSNQAIRADGESIAVFTDVEQTNREIDCFLNDVISDTKPRQLLPLKLPPGAPPINDDGTDWYLVAIERDAPNDVTVTCSPRDKGVDNAQYAYAIVDGYSTRLQVGSAIIWTALVAATAIWIAGWRQARRRRLAAQ